MLGRFSYAGPYALAVGLALAAALTAWAPARAAAWCCAWQQWARARWGFVWLAVGDPHMQWAGLRMTLGGVLRRAGPAGRVVSAEHMPLGWHVVLADGDVPPVS